jgi:hypothetical protein
MLEFIRKWLILILAVLTFIFGSRGWIMLNDLVIFWNNLNPWKTLAVIFFIMFLISCIVSIRNAIHKLKKFYTKQEELIDNFLVSIRILSTEVKELKGCSNRILEYINKLSSDK